MLFKQLIKLRARSLTAAALIGAVCLLKVDVARSAAILIHEYTFTNGTADSVGSMHGTLVGGATISGGLLSLDGVSGHVQLNGFAIPTSNFSITFTAASSGQPSPFTEIISQGSSGAPGFYIGTDLGGRFRLGDQFLGTGVPYPYDGRFHTFTFSSGASGTNFYIDTALVFHSDLAATAPASGTFTRIGRQFDPSYLNEYFRGQIDDLRIYSGEVSPLAVPLAPSLVAQLAAALAILGLVMWRRKRPTSRRANELTQAS